jgi:hypothetical protein
MMMPRGLVALLAWGLFGQGISANAAPVHASPLFPTDVQDFFISCRLAVRTEVTGTYTRSVASLGSDASIAMEPFIASGGRISITGYIAEASQNPTVSENLGVLTIVSESVFLDAPKVDSPKILGLIRPGQTFLITDSIEGPVGSEPAKFHRITLAGKLINPTFNECSQKAR